jgi:hypothetical protein
MVLVVLTTCAAKPITLLPVGEQTVGALRIDVTAGWNTLNADSKGGPSLAIWTCDGALLDRLVIYAGVGDGRTLSVERSKVQLPHFRASMPQNELVAFVEDNLKTMFGDEPAAVVSSNVQVQDFGSNAGILFEVDIAPVELAHYRGTVGAFVAEQKLYLMMYLGAHPHYYDAHLAAAKEMILSARL